MAKSASPGEILRSVFGYEQFKPLQLEVIQNVLKKRDTMAVLPTGGGKSLCYQIPALIFPGLTVVVSPLIALMKDQVEQMQALGVPALFLNSTLSSEQYQANMSAVARGKVKLLYVAPETLLTPRLFSLLSSQPLDCLTIDEAHCISEWGHDFRPEYRQIAAFRQRFPKAVCLALTATATARVRADIQASLQFQTANEFVASFNRENLLIEVIPKSNPAQQTVNLLRRFPNQSGIIYCFSRKQVDELAAFLKSKGFSALPYHAGLEDTTRQRNQERFSRDDVQIIVATIAFGMGINKSNVRFILHYDLPKSIEGYYQEIGRAGRDGLPAHCILLYSYADVRKLRYFIDQKEEPEHGVAVQHLEAMVRYAESDTCRRVPLLGYFGEKYITDNCGMCDNCLTTREQAVDITIPAQKFLSCVVRTGERFAATYVTQVLLGEANEKVLKYGHQNLSTFGIGTDLSLKQWLFIAQQLVQRGFLEQSTDIYRTLKLTPEAYTALKSRTPFWGRLQPEEKEAARVEKKKAGEIDYDQVLFDLLRSKRKELADEAEVPPYVIFSDRTLAEMAAHYPMGEASLLQIHGVGRAKLDRYGKIFIEIIQTYCRSRSLGEKRKVAATPSATPAPRLTPRDVAVAEAYNQGQTIRALMEQYSVQASTIFDHLMRYVDQGHLLRNGGELLEWVQLSKDQLHTVHSAFDRLGVKYLRPVYEHLNGAVAYEDLKVLRLYCLAQQGERSSTSSPAP